MRRGQAHEAVPADVEHRLAPRQPSADAKLEKIITRSLGDGERVNREFRPSMRTMAECEPRLEWPVRIPSRASSGRSRRQLWSSSERKTGWSAAQPLRSDARAGTSGAAETVPNAGHAIHVDEPGFVGARIVSFLESREQRPRDREANARRQVRHKLPAIALDVASTPRGR
jgi:pimeloyl-ACP methyl ester carboxylesterase